LHGTFIFFFPLSVSAQFFFLIAKVGREGVGGGRKGVGVLLGMEDVGVLTDCCLLHLFVAFASRKE
jgi:hypothetical protein